MSTIPPSDQSEPSDGPPEKTGLWVPFNSTPVPKSTDPPEVVFPSAESPSEVDQDRTLQVVKKLNVLTKQEVRNLEVAFDGMPVAGDKIFGFQLISELGRGAFGRVFLATQSELANRPVALKIAPDVGRESARLARLQHTNIVPIHSVYLQGTLQAICMPYLGPNTLTNLISELRKLRRGEKTPLPLIETHFTAKGLDEIDGILTVALRITEGLAHAHERQILHCDLKPANVLYCDDGQPMLLDFNLSHNSRQVASAAVGGTLPYMSPEQLGGLLQEDLNVDQRSDLFSMGVILFEMLTGVDPFPAYPSISIRQRVGMMIDDRRHGIPSLRDHNPKVTPALDAIVHRLLEPDPKKRYQTANELHEDLQRQLEHKPLKYAPDRSWNERWKKFRYRNPRLTSVVPVSLFGLVLVASLTAGLIAREKHLDRWEAREAANLMEKDRREIEFQLTMNTASGRVDQILQQSETTLQHFPQTLLERLDSEERERARSNLADVLYLTAYGRGLKAKQVALESREAELKKAEEKLRELAALKSEKTRTRGALLLQADLERTRGNIDKAQRLERLAQEIRAESSRDLHQNALAAHQKGEVRQAILLLEESLRRDPSNFNAWFLLGICREAHGEPHAAVSVFSTCIALRPEFYGSYFNRGVAYITLRRLPEARHDLTESLRLKPEFLDAYPNRSLTYTQDDEQKEAEADLTRALELNPGSSRFYLLRSRARTRLNDMEGAAADRKKGLELTPVEPVEWVTRGYAKLSADPKGALADFDEALKRNPRYYLALQNKGAVLITHLKQIDASIEVLSQTILLFPDDCKPRAGRGVLYARQGKFKEAIEDAEIALAIDNSPSNLYQVAGIYALCSKENPEYVPEAFRLLGAALRKGFGFDLLDKDRELDPIRNDPRFERTVCQARERMNAKP